MLKIHKRNSIGDSYRQIYRQIYKSDALFKAKLY